MISYIRRCFIGILAGILAGLSSSAFLFLLNKVTNLREANTFIVFLLPIAGLIMGVANKYFGKGLGLKPIFQAAKDGKSEISWRTSPFIFISTLFSHFFGASVGRESTAVQLGAGMADLCLPKFLKLDAEERRTLLKAAMGAGFGSAIGTPIAGFIFSIEVLRFRMLGLWECFLAAMVANYVSVFLHAPHTTYIHADTKWLGWKIIVLLFLLSILVGLFIRTYLFLTEKLEFLFEKLPFALRPFFGGLIITAGFIIFGTRYLGLGIPTIQNAFLTTSPFYDSLLKGFFTVVSTSSGFKGGEFTPLVFMGATMGSALAIWLPSGISILSAAGFSSIFAAASKTPIACTVLAMELFGPLVGVYCLPVCLLSSYVSGKKSLYSFEEKGKSNV